jgi:hypothetical protein
MYSEVDETSISKHNRIMTKAINEMKKDMQWQVNKIKENMNKRLN